MVVILRVSPNGTPKTNSIAMSDLLIVLFVCSLHSINPKTATKMRALYSQDEVGNNINAENFRAAWFYEENEERLKLKGRNIGEILPGSMKSSHRCGIITLS